MNRFRQLYIICVALAMSVVMVNVILIVLRASGGAPPSEVPQPLILTLFALGVVLLAASPSVKAAVFKRAAAEGFDGDSDRLFAAYQRATIAAFALREAAGILGFVLSVLTGNPWWSWGMGGAALIAMIVDWPKPQALGWDQTPGPK
jgi:hypothetical protein